MKTVGIKEGLGRADIIGINQVFEMQTDFAVIARQERQVFWENPMRKPGCQRRKKPGG